MTDSSDDAGKVNRDDVESPSPPAESPEVTTEDQLAGARAYGRRELECSLLDIVLDVTYLAVMAFGVAVILDRWLMQWSVMASPWPRLAAMYVTTMALHYLISFPLSFYSGYLLEHQYGLSRQSFGRWLWRYCLQNVLVVGLGLVLIIGLYAIIWWTGAWWWVVAALATFFVTVLLGQLAPVLVLPLFYKIEPLEDEQLADRLKQLTVGTSLSLEGVYRMKLSSETVKANAMLAGLGRTRRVILGDTLLDQFSADEIEVVFAHEIGHHVFHHISKLILLGIVTSAAGFFVCDVVLRAWVHAHEGAFQYDQLPVYTLPVLLFVVTLSSMLLSPLRNAISRRFETQCDRYALRAVRDPAAYRRAFTKLAKLNKADPDPHPWEVFLMHDHPPIAARLDLAKQMEEEAQEEEAQEEEA